MHRRCLLCKLCALFMIHFQAVAKCQMVNFPLDCMSHQGNAFYALRSCHQILNGDRGEFFSPDYLCSNPALWCNWTIQVQPGKRIQIYLEDLTPGDMCHLKNDQIHLDESPVSSGDNRILEHCWKRSMYTSSSNTVHVVQLIRSNPNPPHRGFYGVYQAFGVPETPDLNKDLSKEQHIKIEETKGKDAATKMPLQKSLSNNPVENIVDAHVRHVEGSQRTSKGNEVLAVTAGSFKESRRIRGNANQVPFDAALPLDDVEELILVSTEKPNWVTTPKYTSMIADHKPHGPETLALSHPTHSIFTSTGTTLTRSTKKKSPKRKTVFTLSTTTMANVNKNELTHISQVTTQQPDHSTEAMAVELPVKDVAPVSLKTDGVQLDSVEFTKNRSNSKKVEQPPKIKDCSRTSVPTLLYAVCFLLCFLIVLLMLVLGMMYRHSHHGRFLPRCQCSSSFTDNNGNNSTRNSEDCSTSRLPPPPPPLHLAGGTHDLPLLRFSPLTPSDGQSQKDTDGI
ncbi:hypothetical protein Baya_1410 [Bagarius yarrelli]|uniref:CUB domain-containing protein n=1 Tax=Bagarius yarrelli TaxID=175774 RepID=A0A556TL22_BAGYA|nr:hypothetical protein Baya_1410 [Bagarius yarrelli]